MNKELKDIFDTQYAKFRILNLASKCDDWHTTLDSEQVAKLFKVLDYFKEVENSKQEG